MIHSLKINRLYGDMLVEKEGGWIQVISSSMSPMIHKNDYCKIVPIEMLSNIKRGDIILNDQMILHRVIGTIKDTLVTRGDHSREVDEPTFFLNILGKVVGTGKIHSGEMIISRNFNYLYWILINRILGLYVYLKSYQTLKKLRFPS